MTWQIVDNPAYAGQTPRRLRAACHDRSPLAVLDHNLAMRRAP